MPLRRSLGISLAFLVISTGANAKTPETSLSHQLVNLHTLGPAKPGLRPGKSWTLSCAHGRTRFAAHRLRHRYAPADADPVDQANSGPPDAYLGPVQPVGDSEFGNAVWYNLVGAQTSSGEVLDRVTATAAHRTLPLASYARVTNLDSGRSVIVKINDRGPWRRRFIIDLSPRAADEINMKRPGVAAVMVEPVVPVDNAGPTVATSPAAGVSTTQ
jgi:rare lipoprotein A (peptidoglycan hydrolase)